MQTDVTHELVYIQYMLRYMPQTFVAVHRQHKKDNGSSYAYRTQAAALVFLSDLTSCTLTMELTTLPSNVTFIALHLVLPSPPTSRRPPGGVRA